MALRVTRLAPKALTYVLLVAGAVLTTLPLFFMIATALKANVYIIEAPPQFIPNHPTLQNFTDAWSLNNFGTFFTNSLLVAISTTSLSVVLSAMMAYAFARFAFPGKSLFFYSLLLTLMIPGLMLVIPQFLLAKTLGLLDNRLGLVFVYIATSLALNTFLLRAFFEQLPRELEQAAEVDGAGHFVIFTRIVVPLSTPALATVAIFTFLFSWDEFPWAVTAINSDVNKTLPMAIALFQSAHQTQWGLVFAASLIAITPVIVVFVVFQRYFVRGLTTGAIKT
jgi:multiple sugar transport system permease protein